MTARPLLWFQFPVNSPQRLEAMKAAFMAASPAARRIMLQGTRNLAHAQGREYPSYRTDAQIM